MSNKWLNEISLSLESRKLNTYEYQKRYFLTGYFEEVKTGFVILWEEGDAKIPYVRTAI